MVGIAVEVTVASMDASTITISIAATVHRRDGPAAVTMGSAADSTWLSDTRLPEESRAIIGEKTAPEKTFLRAGSVSVGLCGSNSEFQSDLRPQDIQAFLIPQRIGDAHPLGHAVEHRRREIVRFQRVQMLARVGEHGLSIPLCIDDRK